MTYRIDAKLAHCKLSSFDIVDMFICVVFVRASVLMLCTAYAPGRHAYDPEPVFLIDFGSRSLLSLDELSGLLGVALVWRHQQSSPFDRITLFRPVYSSYQAVRTWLVICRYEPRTARYDHWRRSQK